MTQITLSDERITPHHAEVVARYRFNEWIKPTNLNSNDFDVFADLFEWGLCERNIDKVYREKTLVGSVITFKISNPLRHDF